MKNTGFNPVVHPVQHPVLRPAGSGGSQGNSARLPAQLRAVQLALPIELKASKYPVLQQMEGIVKSAVKNPKLTTFTDSSFSAWTLFAQSATACGDNLTHGLRIAARPPTHTDWERRRALPAAFHGRRTPPCQTCVVHGSADPDRIRVRPRTPPQPDTVPLQLQQRRT